MRGDFRMEPDDKMDGMWKEFASTTMLYADEIAAEARGLTPKKLTKDEIIWRLREQRDLRREFMAACGECDDAYINQHEIKFLRETSFFFEAAAELLNITDEEIEAAQLPFTTSTGRKTATPQFPPRMDI